MAFAAVLLPCCVLALARPGAATTLDAAAIGCHPEWPVTAHNPDGHAVPPPAHDAHRTVACAVTTGQETSESTIAVSAGGAVFYSPAHTENTMARSLDGGATWSLVQPATMQMTALWNTVDPQVVTDRRTGRIFWVHATGQLRTAPVLVSNSPLPPPIPTIVAYASGFQVYSTADDGHTWRTADYSNSPMGDWEKIAAGPAPDAGTGAAQPSGYRGLVYVCANSPFEVSGPSRLCWRSLDGGTTFAPAGYVLPVTTAGICPPLASNTQVVGSDGTLYVPMTCSGGAYVAVSTDEGGTYTWYPVPSAPVASSITPTAVLQIAADSAGNLYGMWVANDQLMLTVSRDHARTWSTAQSVAAPGVHQVTLPAFAADAPGHVAFAYYASSDGSATALSAYITRTDDALASPPLLVSAAVNDPRHPIYTPSSVFANSHPRADYVGAAFDSRGTFWAGLVDVLGPPPSSGADTPTTGYVAHLASMQDTDATVQAAATNPAATAAAPLALPNTAAAGSTALAASAAVLTAAWVRRRRSRGAP
jgi:hypothetical protein